VRGGTGRDRHINIVNAAQYTRQGAHYSQLSRDVHSDSGQLYWIIVKTV